MWVCLSFLFFLFLSLGIATYDTTLSYPFAFVNTKSRLFGTTMSLLSVCYQPLDSGLFMCYTCFSGGMRHLYEMRCKQCNYTYQYVGEEYEFESCPICNHSAPFSEFVIEVRDEPSKS